MEVGFAWGPTGAAALASDYDVAVVVDVLTFSTTVSVAADRGMPVVPYRWADASATQEAARRGARLAVRREDATDGDVSLSPASFREARDRSPVLLPSPNGATVCAVLADLGPRVVVAGLRNRRAVARYLRQAGGRILLAAAGERWPDDSLRPAVEDLWGAGGVLAALADLVPLEASDEAQAAAAAYRIVENRIGAALTACPSGQELVERGYPSDVEIAAELDGSQAVPVLRDGELVPQ